MTQLFWSSSDTVEEYESGELAELLGIVAEHKDDL